MKRRFPGRFEGLGLFVLSVVLLGFSSDALTNTSHGNADLWPSKGGLRISPSGHYFIYRGKVVMLVGDSGTQCVMQDLNIDYHAWINDLSDRGVNAAHIWAFVAPRQKQDGSVIEKRYGYVYPGATPWKAKTGTVDRFRQWDLTQFDEGSDPQKHYWPRLRDLASYAHDKGICLGVTLFFGWPKHDSAERNDWAIHPFNVANGGHLEHNYETVVIHTPGREVVGEAWSDSWPKAKKTQWVWETYAEKMIDELGSYDNVFLVYKDERSYETGAWQDNMTSHMLSFVRRRSAMLLVDWEAQREDVDAVMVATHGLDKNALAVRAFSQAPARPVVMLESPPYALGESSVRVSMWTFAMGGGHFFFHDDERQGTPATGIMGYDPKVDGGIKPLLTYEWLGHLSCFFNRVVPGLDAMEPHNELVAEGHAYCLANPGSAYACYLPDGGTIGLDIPPDSGHTAIKWYDPRTGELVSAKVSFKVGATGLECTAPSAEDWVVLVRIR